MNKLVCLFVCLAAFLSTGNALKCYSCTSDKADGCMKSQSPKDSTCGAPATNTVQSVCVYRVFHDTSKKTYSSYSGCEQIPSTSAVDKASFKDCATPASGLTVVDCKVCNTDLCNSASMFSTSMITLLCLPIMYLFTKYVIC